MKFKLFFIFILFFSALPLCAMDHQIKLDAELAEAAQAGNSKKVESCLLRGANPDTRINAWETLPTALIVAAVIGNIEIVKLLLNYQADANAQDKYDSTALMHAAANGQTKIVKLLIKYGAHLNLSNMEKRTALTIASQEGYTTIVNILLKKGAHVDVDHFYFLLTCLPVVKHPQLIELPLKHINHILDKTDDPEICHKWDQYILDSLSNIETQWWWTYPIKTINAFRMLLHHASKLPLSTKKLKSLTLKALRERRDGEESFRETVKHIRKKAF